MTPREYNLFTWVAAHGHVDLVAFAVYTNTMNSTHPARFYLWSIKERDMNCNWSHYSVVRSK